MRKQLTTLSAVAVACLAVQTATAQYFTNDLTDVSVTNSLLQASSGPEGTWGFSSDNIITVLDPTNTTMTVQRTNATAGASTFATSTNDIDSCRSYLATQYGAYSTTNWKAHVTVEHGHNTGTGDPERNILFFGIGNGVAAGANSEPQSGDWVRLAYQVGGSFYAWVPQLDSSDGPRQLSEGSHVHTYGAELYMTYFSDSGALKVELDLWEDDAGTVDGVMDHTLFRDISGIDFNLDTEARIFFGGNVTMTFSDFWVQEAEPTVPTPTQGLYAWPETNNSVSVYWDVGALADSYVVYRSLDDVTSNYVQIGTATTNHYVDAPVTAGVTYYYKVAGVNAFGEGDLSSSEFAVANENDIFGLMVNSGGAMKTRWFYELFDGMTGTFFDDNAVGGYGGLDYGVADEPIVQIDFFLRDDGFGRGGTYYIVIDGVSNTVTRAQYMTYGNSFEGSNDGIIWTWIQAITNIAEQSAWNSIPVTDGTAYRYVRYFASSGNNNYAMAEVDFLKASDFTAKGTPIKWLEQYGLMAGDDEVDNDSDGLLTWEEYIAGTVPTNAASVLKVNSFANTTNGWVVSWQSVEGKDYSIITNDTVMAPITGVAVSNIVGLADETSITSSLPAADALFLQVEVK